MSALPLRDVRTLGHIYPCLLVALAAVTGAWLGSERHGIGPDYNIDDQLTAERIAHTYAPAIQGLKSFYDEDNDAARERRRSELTATLRSDETIVGATVEVRPTDAPIHSDFAYSAVDSKGESCLMRSVAASRSGLVRCHMDTEKGGADVLRLTRPIAQTDDVTAIAILKLDYRKVRQRLRQD
jgi:hypothetical protein